MRVLLVLVLMAAPMTRLFACSCNTPGTPCAAAGIASAVFTGTVLEIVDPARPFPIQSTTPASATRRRVDSAAPQLWSQPTVRLQVKEVLSGVGEGQIEVLTGLGDSDCGLAFQVGVEYVVYAFKNADGRLVTGLCSRTRPVTEAPDDVAYIRAMANAPATGEIRVHTRVGNTPGKPRMPIVVEWQGSRYQSLTNAAGDALFTGLQPGAYTVRAPLDGDQSDDPTVELHAKGCLDVVLFRALRINGRVTTKTGEPVSRVQVQTRSIDGAPGESTSTFPDGRYQLRIVKPGEYYLGVNLNGAPTRETPYPRWFYPGTGDPAGATKIVFTGRPEVRTHDFALPDRQLERSISGIVSKADGQPIERVVVTIFDASRNIVAQANADQSGRFSLQVFAGMPYRLLAVSPGRTRADAVSAVPVDIAPDTGPLTLRLTLTQPGNLLLNERQPPIGAVR